MPTVGVLRYNGFSFDALSASDLSITPVWDNAHWTVKYYEYRLSVRAYFAGHPLDYTDIERRLMAPAGELVYVRRGKGVYSVNRVPVPVIAASTGDLPFWVVDHFELAPPVLDGRALVDGDLVLVKNQASQFQNGLYIVTDAALGVWHRWADFDTASEAEQGYLVSVTNGAVNSGKRFQLANQPETIDVSPIIWVETTINAPDGPKDSVWGPWPQRFTASCLGGSSNAFYCTYEIVWHAPNCDDARFVGNLAQQNHSIVVDVDVDGYTSLRYSGSIEIPMTRPTQAERVPPDSIDAGSYLNRCFPQVPTGFRRSGISRTISEDRRSMTYSFTDTEMGGVPLPSGVSSIDMTERVDAQTQKSFAVWTWSLGGKITMVRGARRSDAANVFLAILFGRLNRLTVLRGAGQHINFMPLSVSFSNEIFGKSSSFSVTFAIFGNRQSDAPASFSGLVAILKDSGMWVPVQKFSGVGGYSQADWTDWEASMGFNLQPDPRGWQGIRYAGNTDAIVDLCLDTVHYTSSVTPRLFPDDPGYTSTAGDREGELSPLNPPPPTPSGWDKKNSIIGFDSRITVLESARVARHKPLKAGNVTTYNAQPSATDSADFLSGAQTDLEPASTNPTPDKLQEVSSPNRMIMLSGFGVRVNFPPVIPALVDVPGATVREVERIVEEKVVSSWMENTIYRTDWAIIYEVIGSVVAPIPFPTQLLR